MLVRLVGRAVRESLGEECGSCERSLRDRNRGECTICEGMRDSLEDEFLRHVRFFDENREEYSGLANRKVFDHEWALNETKEESPGMIVLEIIGLRDMENATLPKVLHMIIPELYLICTLAPGLDGPYCTETGRFVWIVKDEETSPRGEDFQKLLTQIQDIITFVKTPLQNEEGQSFIPHAQVLVSGCEPSPDARTKAEHARIFARKKHRPVAAYSEEIRDTYANEAEVRFALLENPEGEKDGSHITPFFQPIVDIDGKIIYAEALARLCAGDDRIVLPAFLFPVVEELGMESLLTRVMLARTFRIAQENFPDLPFSVNMTLSELSDTGIQEYIYNLLRQNPNIARNLTIEILESSETTLSCVESFKHAAQSFQRMGVSFYLDDFGVAFSNVDRLLRLVDIVDGIKVDRSIIQQIGGDVSRPEWSVASGTIALLSRLVENTQRPLKLVLEGVETDEELARLHELTNNALVQGYRFYRPMRTSDMKAQWDRQKITTVAA